MWVGPTQTRLLEMIKEYDLHTLCHSLRPAANIAEIGGKRLTANGEAIGFDPKTQEEV
jgi:hypothetical protein